MRKIHLNMFLTTILMVASMSAYALDKADGVYQIATADDLNAFAELVNGGEVNANAVLTADIDKGTENYRIGCDGQDYQGTFDGNGHTITYNMTFDEDGASLFRNVGIQGIIQNLKVQGIINTNSSFAGSIAGWNRGRIIGCYADVTINSSKEGIANHGGLVGRCYFGAVIENCLVKVAIKGEKSQICGGVIGWTSDRINIINTLVVSEGTILDNSNGYSCNIACCPSINNPITVVTKNVYVVNPISNDYGRDGNKYTFYENEEGIANGELAFLLNGKQSGLNRFYQVIGTDPMPTPLMNEGGRIYVTAPEFRCDGLPIGNTTFSNTYTSDPVIPDHHFVDGWCTVCEMMDENFITPVNGWLEISSGAQLKWWSAYAFTHEDCKARLTADINMEGYCEGYTPPQIFTGQFDGQGHVISNFIIESSSDYQGLIGIIGNGAFIKNLVLDKTCSITGNAFCGVIGGTNGSGDIYIDRVGNEGTVATYNQNAAGILGIDMQGSMNLHITNCYVTGTIDGGRESGAICGYSNTNSEVINCWSTATIPQYSIYSSDSFTRGPAKVTNCYEAAIEGVDATKQQHINPIAEDRRVNPITLEEVANGSLCYKLNESRQGGENFYQVIGTDPIPLPFAKEGGKVYCQGNSVYSNTPPINQEGTWTDANGTEWYFSTTEGNATISCRGWDDANSRSIPSISGTIPEELAIPATVYIGETPYSVTSIGYAAFRDCSSITSVTIPSGVTSIGYTAFYNSSITSVTIPNGVTSIGNAAFSYCSSLNAVIIPESVTSIDGNPFAGCRGLTSIVVREENTVYDSRDGCNAIIETVSNILVSGCMNTIIPDGIKSIGNSAFIGCSSLTTITIPNEVTSIGSSAFWGCSSLTSFTIPKGVTSIENGVFNGCSSLTSITIPESVTCIEGGAFKDCSSLTSLTIPESVTSIGEWAFYGCSSLTSITIPNGVSSLGLYAFGWCSNLTSITIPEGVTSIGSLAFDACSSLTSITLPESVTSIGSAAFQSCSSLASITIPEGVKSIERKTFFRCKSLTIITIPDGVTSIGDRAFAECSKLATITIPEGVNTISEYAFEYCNDLTSVIVGMLTPINLSSNSFSSETYETATLYVPAGSKAAYQAADVWNDFKKIIEYNYVDGSQDPPFSEYLAAMSVITDCRYYLTTEVNGTNYYVTQNGYLTDDKESAYLFAISKDSGSSVNDKLYDVAFLIDPDNGAHFSNPTPLLDGKAYLHLGFFYQDKYNNRSEWERQVLFLNETGKFAIRSSNVTYGEDGWLDAGRTFWSWEENGSIIPCYSYEPAYIWALEEPVGKVKLYLILDDLYTLYENQLYDDVDNPDYVNMGSGYGQYADWVTWRKFKAELDKLDALIQKFLDEDYNPELDSDCPDLDGVNAWKTEIAALWQKILDSKVTDISELDNAIYIEPFTARVGDKMQMEICLKNAEAATAYVFDMVLPEGITVPTNDKGKYIDELSDRHDDHTRTINYKGENTYSLSTLSGNSEELTGNDGAIRLVTIAVSDNMAEGNYAIDIKNASYSKPDGTLVSLPDVRAVVTVEDYVLGDVNGNGGVDIGDAVSIVNYLVGKDSSNFVAKAADTNKNGQIDIGDAVTIVNLLVGKITSLTRELNIIWDDKNPE